MLFNRDKVSCPQIYTALTPCPKSISPSIRNKSNVNDVYYCVFMLNMLYECLSDNRYMWGDMENARGERDCPLQKRTVPVYTFSHVLFTSLSYTSEPTKMQWCAYCWHSVLTKRVHIIFATATASLYIYIFTNKYSICNNPFLFSILSHLHCSKIQIPIEMR